MEHNLKYNDDTIFDNISIFRDVNNSGLYHPKIVDKEVHPLKMKQKFEIEEDEDEEESQKKESPIQSTLQIDDEEKKDESITEKYFDTQEEDQKLGVSPISKNICQTSTSYQDVSKDLIDLESSNQLEFFKKENS